MKKLISVLMVIVIMGLMSCTQSVSAGVLKSDRPRVTSPQTSQADLATLTDGNSDFAFELYQVLRNTDGNLFYSPYSISLALAMTYAGARGETREQMASTLRFSLAQDNLHPAFNSLDIELASRGEGAQGKDEEGFRLNIVNAIWGQKDYIFLPQYLDVLAQNYGAGMRIVDFMNETERSRVTINDWVSEQTENRIKDLIPPGVVDRQTRLVLTNAIYFNAAWQYPFTEAATVNGQFYLLNGSDITVPMMQQTEAFPYIETTDYQAVELPYGGQELSMLIIIPRSGQFLPFEEQLDANLIDGIIMEMRTQEIILSMPKFEFESKTGLKDALSQLGMGVAFTEDADFSGMNGNRDLSIQDVLHKAFVSVDEAGTEAAAATAVIVGVTSAPTEPRQVKIDRPFMFLIRDIPTNSILFVGRVLNPIM